LSRIHWDEVKGLSRYYLGINDQGSIPPYLTDRSTFPEQRSKPPPVTASVVSKPNKAIQISLQDSEEVILVIF